MSPLVKRSLSAVVLVIVMVEMTVASAVTFYTLWSIIGLLSVIEYHRLIRKSPVGRARVYRIGYLYIIGPIALLMTIDQMMVLTLMTIVWANDTGAYLVGSSIGKHRMAPSISPKKSWEGFAGGLLFAIGVALVWQGLYWNGQSDAMVDLFGGEVLEDSTSMKLRWAAFGLVIALGSVVGDLVESKFKRLVGVKDSGSIIPGHGGMLDRFDAILLAAPLAWIYLKLVELT